MEALERCWLKVPDWRLGQLFENIKTFSGKDDLFYMEDDDMTELIEFFYKEYLSDQSSFPFLMSRLTSALFNLKKIRNFDIIFIENKKGDFFMSYEIRKVKVSVMDSQMILEFEQYENESEEDFEQSVIDYILSDIEIEVLQEPIMKFNIVRCKTGERITTINCESLDEACAWTEKVGYEDGDVDIFFANKEDLENYHKGIQKIK